MKYREEGRWNGEQSGSCQHWVKATWPLLPCLQAQLFYMAAM